MLKKFHLTVAILATLTIATFFTSTVIVELFGSHQDIAIVTGFIVAPGLFMLIPAIAATGISGFRLSRRKDGPLVDVKMKRMRIIAANGLLILVPTAIFLAKWASAGYFNTGFILVQAVELLAGAMNLMLMALNMRDGLRVSSGAWSSRRGVR